MAAPARAVKFPAMRVAETLRGMRRSLSMMWITPLSNSRSWAGLILLILDALKKTWTHGDNDLACSLDTAGNDRVSFFVEVHRDNLPTGDVAAADFAIQYKARVIEVARQELRNLLDVCRFDNSLGQVVSQNLLDEFRVSSSLFDAEDATLGNNACESIVAWCKESHFLLRGEEVGGVLDLTEQSDKSGERFLAGEDCCEVLCRGGGSSECCQEKIVGSHFSRGRK